MRNLTRSEWDAIPADYKIVRPDGGHAILQLIEGLGTCLVDVRLLDGLRTPTPDPLCGGCAGSGIAHGRPCPCLDHQRDCDPDGACAIDCPTRIAIEGPPDRVDLALLGRFHPSLCREIVRRANREGEYIWTGDDEHDPEYLAYQFGYARLERALDAPGEDDQPWVLLGNEQVPADRVEAALRIANREGLR